MEAKLSIIAAVISAIFTVMGVILQLRKKNQATKEMKQSGILNKQIMNNSNQSVTINNHKEKE